MLPEQEPVAEAPAKKPRAPKTEQVPTHQRYLVRSKNPEYSGKTAGVAFNKGQALVEDLTIDKSLGYRVDQVAQILTDMGYVVEQVA